MDMEWQPIETAPQGEWVLVAEAGSPRPAAVAMRESANVTSSGYRFGWSWVIDASDEAGERMSLPINPTHWMPLPAPQKAYTEKEPTEPERSADV